MAPKELIHTIPLRKQWLKVPRYKRTQKAIKAIREYIKKHSKQDNVKIGKYLNLRIWENGMKNPPHKITVKIIKESDHAFAELPDVIIEKKEETKKPEEKKEQKPEEKKEEKKEETKQEKEQKALEKEEKQLDKKAQPKDIQEDKTKQPSVQEQRKETIYPRTKKTKNE